MNSFGVVRKNDEDLGLTQSVKSAVTPRYNFNGLLFERKISTIFITLLVAFKRVEFVLPPLEEKRGGKGGHFHFLNFNP